MWPPGHSGYCSLPRAAVAAICHETRPGEALQNPGCTAPFKITQEGARAGGGREGEEVMEEEEGEGGGGGGGGERGARCCCWPLVVTEAGEDNRRRHMAGERGGQKRQNKAARRGRCPHTHRQKHLRGFFVLHLNRKTARRAY